MLFVQTTLMRRRPTNLCMLVSRDNDRTINQLTFCGGWRTTIAELFESCTTPPFETTFALVYRDDFLFGTMYYHLPSFGNQIKPPFK